MRAGHTPARPHTCEEVPTRGAKEAARVMYITHREWNTLPVDVLGTTHCDPRSLWPERISTQTAPTTSDSATQPLLTTSCPRETTLNNSLVADKKDIVARMEPPPAGCSPRQEPQPRQRALLVHRIGLQLGIPIQRR